MNLFFFASDVVGCGHEGNGETACGGEEKSNECIKLGEKYKAKKKGGGGLLACAGCLQLVLRNLKVFQR